MVEFSTQFALVTLAAAVLIAVVRLVRGPTLPDRVVAMDLIGVLVVGLTVVLAASTDVRATLDAAIVVALIAFVATVAYATYIERGHPE
jgi:multicomponent Na+:H+ antiporter subunit F